jgi:hypothetical protein
MITVQIVEVARHAANTSRRIDTYCFGRLESLTWFYFYTSMELVETKKHTNVAVRRPLRCCFKATSPDQAKTPGITLNIVSLNLIDVMCFVHTKDSVVVGGTREKNGLNVCEE